MGEPEVLLSFFAEGWARPQGSKKNTSAVGTAHVWSREAVDPHLIWRGIVSDAAVAAARACGLAGPISVPVRLGAYYFLRKDTGTTREWPSSRNDGDIEKLIRSTNDALQQWAPGALVKAGVLKDDALVVQFVQDTGKYWARGDQKPGVWMWLEPAVLPAWYIEGKVWG